ncbi:MAG TPA: hypothetical protein VMV31_02710 [Terriglobales bacterium]|nr:hypothetical protein [Terriglobales bacterium]
MTPRAQIIYFEAGGGHAAAARALAEAMQARGEFAVEVVNLQELLAPLDVMRRAFGVNIQDCYNLLLRREWTLGIGGLAPILQAAIGLRQGALERALERHWEARPAEVVVSVVPHFNRVLQAGLRRGRPQALFAVALTDLADYPAEGRRCRRNFWLTATPDLVFCGTAKAVEQARAAGCAPASIVRTSGMILRPSFYAQVEAGGLDETVRGRQRQGLGLAPDVPTALVLFGGAGSRRMLLIARELERVQAPLQAIFLCGRSERVAAELRRRWRHRLWVEGYSERVPDFMRLADFFIGKPGPGSLSEALQMRLPAIVERNAWTLPQERYNAQWLEEQGYGISLPSFRRLHERVEWLLAPGRLEEWRGRLAGIHNRAVFEIAERLGVAARLRGLAG